MKLFISDVEIVGFSEGSTEKVDLQKFFNLSDKSKSIVFSAKVAASLIDYNRTIKISICELSEKENVVEEH